MKKHHSIKVILVLFIVFSHMSGCAPAPPIISGRNISQDQLSQIKEGKSTKSELLELVGPPYAILRQGKTTMVQDPPVHTGMGGISKSKTKLLNGDAVFSLFIDNVEIYKDHRVYYYYYSKSSSYTVFLLLWIHANSKNILKEFYFLVDERDQVVDKVFSLKSKPKAVNKMEKEDKFL